MQDQGRNWWPGVGGQSVVSSVVLDTSVLYPFNLRDTLLRSAEAGLFRPVWSPRILAELRGALLHKAGLTSRQIDHLIRHMTESFPKAETSGYDVLLPAMTNHPDDRHVLALAVHARATKIVTSNLKHFKPGAVVDFNTIAESPDGFLCDLFDSNRVVMTSTIQQQAHDRTRPPISVAELLDELAEVVPGFTDMVRVRLLTDQL